MKLSPERHREIAAELQAAAEREPDMTKKRALNGRRKIFQMLARKAEQQKNRNRAPKA